MQNPAQQIDSDSPPINKTVTVDLGLLKRQTQQADAPLEGDLPEKTSAMTEQPKENAGEESDLPPENAEELESLNDYIGRLLAQVDLVNDDGADAPVSKTMSVDIVPAKADDDPAKVPSHDSPTEPNEKEIEDDLPGFEDLLDRQPPVDEMTAQVGRIARGAYGMFFAVVLLGCLAVFFAWSTLVASGHPLLWSGISLGLAYLGALGYARLSSQLTKFAADQVAPSPSHQTGR